jgi:hypothetical protein
MTSSAAGRSTRRRAIGRNVSDPAGRGATERAHQARSAPRRAARLCREPGERAEHVHCRSCRGGRPAAPCATGDGTGARCPRTHAPLGTSFHRRRAHEDPNRFADGTRKERAQVDRHLDGTEAVQERRADRRLDRHALASAPRPETVRLVRRELPREACAASTERPGGRTGATRTPWPRRDPTAGRAAAAYSRRQPLAAGGPLNDAARPAERAQQTGAPWRRPRA